MKHRFTQLPLRSPQRLAVACLLACGLWLSGLSAATAQETCLLLPMSLEERVQAAQVVVEGKG